MPILARVLVVVVVVAASVLAMVILLLPQTPMMELLQVTWRELSPVALQRMIVPLSEVVINFYRFTAVYVYLVCIN